MQNDELYDENIAEQGFTALLDEDETKFARMVKKTVTHHDQVLRPYRDKAEWNADYWRDKHYKRKKPNDNREPEPNVPVAHSTIENGVADSMDSYPDAIMRGVNGDDDLISIIMTEAVRFTMQRARHQSKYEKAVRSAHKVGTGVLQTFFNPDLAKGLGDIDYRYIDIKNFVWDTNVSYIDDGFFVAVKDYISHEEFNALYPDMDVNTINAYDENEELPTDSETDEIRAEQKKGIECITIYWKDYENRTYEDEKEDEDGNAYTETVEMDAKHTLISSAKVIGDKVIESHTHQYEHDSYMFRMLPYIPLENEPVGLSFTDIFVDQIDLINRMQKEFVKNLQASSVLRYMVNGSANIDESALMDFNKRIVRGDVIHENALRAFPIPQFSGQVLQYQQAIMGQIKEFSGQTDFNIGQTSAGVTAAAAIKNLQDFGAKKSRLFIRACYEEFKLQVRDTIKLMQVHYETGRVIRISPEAREMAEKIMAEQVKGREGQTPEGMETTPILQQDRATGRYEVDFEQIDLDNFDLDYDIQIIAQRKTPATSNFVNSMAQQFANAGAMPPDMVLELTEFEGKDRIVRKVRERMGVQKQMNDLIEQMKQLSAQTQEAMKQNQDMKKTIKDLEDQVWKEKLNTLKAQVLAKGAEDDGSADEIAEIEAFENAVVGLQQPTQGGFPQGL